MSLHHSIIQDTVPPMTTNRDDGPESAALATAPALTTGPAPHGGTAGGPCVSSSH